MRGLDAIWGVLRHRRRVAAVVLVLALLAAAGLSQLSIDFDPRALVPGGDQLPRTLVALVDIDPQVSEDDRQRVFDVSEAWSQAEGVRRVDSITHTPLPVVGEDESDESLDALLTLIEVAPDAFPRGLTDIAERTGGPLTLQALGTDARVSELAPQLRGGLIGRAGQSAIVVAQLDRHADALALEALVQRDGVQVTGLPLLEADVERELTDDPLTLLFWAALGNLLVLAWGFRARAGVVIPLSAAGLTVLIVMGGLAWLGIRFSLLDVILPPLLLTLGVSDAVHLLSREHEERNAHSPEHAARRAMSVMARACLATSVTTALGFGSLALARAPAVSRFAMLSVVGVFVAFAITVVVVPAMLPSFAPTRPRRFPRSASDAVLRHASLIMLAAIALAGIAAYTATEIRTGTHLLAPFGEDHARVQTTRRVETEHGGVRELAVHVSVDEAEAMATWLSSRPEVLRIANVEILEAIWRHLSDEPRPAGTLDELAAIADAAGQPVSLTTLEVGIPDLATNEVLAFGHAIEARGGSIDGEAWTTTQGLVELTHDLVVGFAIALVLIVLLLALLLRNLRLGLLSLPPNLLPLLFVGGWMGMRDIPLNATTAMVFAITFGLVVDGTIHLVMRFREERRTHDRDNSARNTLERSGRAVWIGGLTLVAGFAPILCADFQPLRLFAELSLVAIGSAVVVELLLTPALLKRFG